VPSRNFQAKRSLCEVTEKCSDYKKPGVSGETVISLVSTNLLSWLINDFRYLCHESGACSFWPWLPIVLLNRLFRLFPQFGCTLNIRHDTRLSLDLKFMALYENCTSWQQYFSFVVVVPIFVKSHELKIKGQTCVVTNVECAPKLREKTKEPIK
jgi:hypothetical protein